MNSFLKERLNKLNDRLLDITSRNKMISSNFNAKNRRFFRFIDEIPNVLYKKLQTNSMSFAWIPEEKEEIDDEDTEEFKNEYLTQLSTNLEYLTQLSILEDESNSGLGQGIEDAKRKLKDYVREIIELPEKNTTSLSVKAAAKKNNIVPDFNLPFSQDNVNSDKKYQDNLIQTLMFKEELDSYLKNISRIYKSSRAESGINPLYICFGFLEWKESASSEKTLYSPILISQVEILETKKKTDIKIKMSDTPISINFTLNEKLKRSHNIELPDININEENDFNVEKYLDNVEDMVKKFNWSVKRWGTFGIYEAHLMPIFEDINNILKNDSNDLLEKLLIGVERESDQDNADLYDIDLEESKDQTLPALVCDADASQHSAVIDALSGDSFVIKGPPGTGKSQTITNIISSLMVRGKKVLFIAQKQAALDVVRNRLESVGLANYILEAFAAKASKKSILQSIAKRIDDEVDTRDINFSFKYEKYKKCKSELNLYSKIMKTEFAQTKTKIHDLLWDHYEISEENNHHNMKDLVRFDKKNITETELNKDIEQLSYFKNTYSKIFSEPDNIRSSLLKIRDIPSNPFDRNDLSQKINSFEKELLFYNNEKKEISNYLKCHNIFSFIDSNVIIKKIILSENLTSSEEWKIFNLFLNEHTIKNIENFKNASKKHSKLISDYDNFLKQIDSHSNFSSESVISITLKEIENTFNVLKTSHFFSFLFTDYNNAKNLCIKTFKVDGFFYNYLPLLNEIKVKRKQSESKEKEIRESYNTLTSYKKILTSFDSDLEKNIDHLLDDPTYVEYFESSKNLSSEFKSFINNNPDNFNKLQKHYHTHISLQAFIDDIFAKLDYDLQDVDFYSSISIINNIRQSDISLNDYADYLRNFNSNESKRFCGYFKTYILSKYNLDYLEKNYKNIIRMSQQREIYNEFPELDRFSSQYVNKLRLDLKIFDVDLKNSAKSLYASQIKDLGSNAPRGKQSGRVKEKTDMGLLNHICRTTRSSISLRHMFSNSLNAITAIKPCTLMSPLTVSQLLPLNQELYDTVIIDEASQMKPEYAIGAIARTKQLIVVGDQKQLPPSRDFESRFSDDNDDDDVVEESILDLALTVFHPARELLFHYRSRHEDLIKFSNAKFYQNLLIPATAFINAKDKGIKHFYLDKAVYQTGNSGTGGINIEEANKVVAEAIHIMQTRPDESLGIATMNCKQQNYIDDLIESKKNSNPAVLKYIKKWQTEDNKINEFFVKNLANVQGDERDIIIVSTLFGPDKVSGKVRQTFGPIVQTGGQRRLNVLFTRAKNQLILITSLKSSDIKIEDTSKEGKIIFKDYLAYAESDTKDILIGEPTGMEVESPFQQWAIDIIDSVDGFSAEWEIGVKGYRIDIGVKHEDYPQGYILAVETDGASYHSTKSARDRDLLRQEILESHGWVFHRIWSTDRFQDPVGTKNRLINAMKSRLDSLLQKNNKAVRIMNSLAVINTKVIHKKFGEGRIISKEGSDLDTKVQISFKEFGVKWLVLAVAHLEIIK